MIEKHRAVLRALSDEDVDLISEALRLTGPLLIEAIEARGLAQADVVVALLRYRDFVGALWQDTPVSDLLSRLCRLHRAPPERPWPRPLPTPPPRLPDPGQHWVAWVREGHVRLGVGAGRGCRSDVLTPGRRRVRIRVGMTVAELERAGVTRAELRAAQRAGDLRLSAEVRHENRDPSQ